LVDSFMDVNAETRREVLSGPSLLTWGRIMLGSLIWLPLGGAATLLLLLSSQATGSGSLTVAFHVVSGVWFATFLFAVFGSVLGATTRSKAELAAGYTTTPYRNQEVDLVDSRTGIVLRSAGEPLLDRETFKARRSAARAKARAEPPVVSSER
jgi:hypothetical protein